MCYGMFNFGACCEPTIIPGFQDIFAPTASRGHQSSTRYFTRACVNNTKELNGNGKQVEAQWGAKRTGPFACRTFTQSCCPWPGGTVWVNEGGNSMIGDEALPLDLSTINGRGAVYPIIVPNDEGWLVGSGAANDQFVSADLYQSGIVSIGMRIIHQLPMDWAVVFRAADKDNCQRVRFAYSTFAMYYERISAGVATILATIPVSGSGPVGPWTDINIALNGTSLTVGALNQPYLSWSFGSSTVAAAAAGSRVGIWKNTNASGRVDYFSASSGPGKAMVGVYSAGSTPSHVGDVINTQPEAGTIYDYAGAPLLAGSVAYQHGKGATGDLGSVDYTQRIGGSAYDADGNAVQGPFYEISFTVNDTSIWGGGQEIDGGAGRTERAELKFRPYQWSEPGNYIPPPPPVYRPGNGTWNTFTYAATRNQMGFDVIGAIAKRGYPYSAGLILKSVTYREGPAAPTNEYPFDPFYGPTRHIGIYRVKWQVVIGPWVWDGAYVPHTDEQIIVAEFEKDFGFYPQLHIYGDGFGDFEWVPLSENYMRFHAQTNINTPHAVAKAPTGFDCTTGAASWFMGTQQDWHSWKVIDESWDGSSFTQIEPIEYVNSRLGVGGAVYEFTSTFEQESNIVLGDGVACFVVREGGPAGATSFRLFGGGFNFPIGQNGLTSADPFLMSDRFVYANLEFDTPANAKAFCTASLSSPEAANIAGTGRWMISRDGSIRYPVAAWVPPFDPGANPHTPVYSQTSTQYDSRDRAEIDGAAKWQLLGAMFRNDGLAAGDFDCIKDSSIPFAPPLANPTF